MSPATTQLMVFLQMELKAGKGASERPGPDWKAALQREREEQQHLLAESYSAVMELTRQLQMSERHWSQEKLQLVERLQGEKQQVEQQVKELQNRLSQVRWDPGAQAAEALRERRESRAIDFASILQAPLCSLRSYVCQPRMPASRKPIVSCTSYSLTVAIRTFFPHKFTLARRQVMISPLLGPIKTRTQKGRAKSASIGKPESLTKRGKPRARTLQNTHSVWLPTFLLCRSTPVESLLFGWFGLIESLCSCVHTCLSRE